MARDSDAASLQQALSQQLFFRGMEPEHLSLLAEFSARRQFEPGEYLCREGEEADLFYVVESGLVALELTKPEHGDFAVQSLEAGDILGWSWLVPPYRWRFTARVVEHTHAIALDGRCLRSRCEQNHELGYQLLVRLVQVMTERLETTRRQLIANTRMPVESLPRPRAAGRARSAQGG
ncbi:MAG: cyclic nucleotide-binding domain-containing protein [Candidatus Latescibacterota bacterium]